jgi:amino acid adenylation domain-containing protein
MIPHLLVADKTRAQPSGIVARTNVAASSPPATTDLAALVEAAARREPHDAAVTLGRETLTYRELDELAGVLAQGLSGRVGEAGIVAIALPRSPETAALMLATQKAGLAYLPLDSRHPRKRLQLMLDDASADVLVHDGTAGLAHPRAVSLRDLVDRPAAPPPSRRREDPDRLAYVLYTSGSTGRPKGVAMTQRPLSHLIEWQVRRSRPAPRTLQLAPLGFDVSFQEMFSTWAAGGELVLMPPEAQHDPDAVLDLLARADVERLFAPWSRLQQIADVYDPRRRPTALKELVTAGEQVILTPQLRAFCADLGATLDNQYGPTETHAVTALLLEGDPLRWPERPSIGRPLPHVELEIRDDAGRLVPDGTLGELWIGGAAPARGYVGRSGGPFLAFPDGRRFYRSGDLVRRDPGTGEIEFHGRADDQVKIRGFRVELGEVEAALVQLPSVAAAAATVKSGGSRPQQLVAHVVPRKDARPPGDAELRSHLRERLPDYMIPAAFVTLPELPVTPSGKVDRKRLPDPPRLRNVTSAFAPPGTPLERDLAALWRELLGVEAVGVDDDFVELGGDSLLSVRLLQQIRRRLRCEAALDDLLAAPTIRGLAATLRPAQQATVDVRRVDRTGVSTFPASVQQEQLWILQQRYPESPAYNVYSATEIEGPLDVQALRSALASLVSRHEALRTV